MIWAGFTLGKMPTSCTHEAYVQTYSEIKCERRIINTLFSAVDALWLQSICISAIIPMCNIVCLFQRIEREPKYAFMNEIIKGYWLPFAGP